MRFDIVVSEDTKGRNDVFSEILVLIVAPDQNKVGFELVECIANRSQTFKQRAPMLGSRGFALIDSIFFAHPWRPVARFFQVGRNGSIAKSPLKDTHHVFIPTRKGWI